VILLSALNHRSSRLSGSESCFFAYVVVMSLPMGAVFLVGQRKIVSGITSGAVT
jgi:ABC-type glycerol-3-phosphate transport system permease component